eukprot:PITA_33086
MYSFGDSLTDTGNGLASSPLVFRDIGSSPYGETFFHHPTGRCSNGRLVIDFLATALGFPFLQPYLKVGTLPLSERESGVNFAVAGATALDPSFLTERLILTQTELSLDVQIGWFQELKQTTCTANSDCQNHFSKALYVMGEIGANDYLDSTFLLKPLEQIQSLTPLVISKIQNALQVLIENGAQYIFVQGIPPLGCSPSILTVRSSLIKEDYDENSCLISYNQLSQNHNTLLQETLQQLRVQYPDVTLVYGDYYNIALEILKNHAAYGFNNIFQSCCGGGGTYNFNILSLCGSEGVVACSNPSTYTNWDGIHLTEATYEIASDFILNKAGYTQPSFSSLSGKACPRLKN